MNFYSAQDLRTESKIVWESLASDGEVVITDNGKPSAIMLNIAGGGFENVLKAVRQARAMMAFNALRKKVAETGGFMSDDEIEVEIAAARKEHADASGD